MYDSYKHLIGRAYTSGDKDCYGLARDYYKDVFDLTITNVARPEEWWNDGRLDLINDLFDVDGWENIGCNLRNLKVGDALVFSLISGRANHVGVYVGNGMFIHHVYQRMSCEESLAQKWRSRCLMVVRHTKVTEAQDKNMAVIGLEELRKNVKP